MPSVCVLGNCRLKLDLIGRFLLVVPVVWAAPHPSPSAGDRALVDQYCITCHNQKAPTAHLMLDKMDLADVPARAETWEKVIQKLRGGTMPPLGLPRPNKTAVDGLIAYLETSLDQAYRR